MSEQVKRRVLCSLILGDWRSWIDTGQALSAVAAFIGFGFIGVQTEIPK